MASFGNDVRYAARMLGKNPASSILAVVALALGIGLTTMMFSIVYGALIKGLPFESPDRILHVERANPSEDIESMGVPIHDYLDWEEQQTSFAQLAAFFQGTVNVAGSETPERFDGAFISANSFNMLGVQPALGRLFREGEDAPSAEQVMLIGHEVWRDRYESSPEVVGRVESVNGEPTTIVGVMPEGFRFPVAEEVWVPMRTDALELERGQGTFLEVFGRLRDGVSADQAFAEFQGIAARLATAYPETNEGVVPLIKPYTEEFIGEEPVLMLYTMLLAVFLVLLIACINVANLLISRAAQRSKEVGIRSALGATRRRIIVQFLAEAGVLAFVGAALGVALAAFGIRAFNTAIAPTDPPFWIQIGLDPQVLAFVVGLAVVATLVAGIIPAVQASRANVNEILKDETRGTSSFRMGWVNKALVAGEIALSVALLIGAGLMVKSIAQLRNLDYPFAADNVFTARVGLFEADYPDEADRIRFYQELQPRVAAIPGVEAATLTSNLPGLFTPGPRVEIDGEAYEAEHDIPRARQAVITPGHFETFDVSLLQGRDFGSQDRADGLKVAIINQSFADKFFPGEDPLGERFRLYAGEEPDSLNPWMSVVGVSPDLMMNGIADNEDDQPREGYYKPLVQESRRFMSIAARTRGQPTAITQDVRRAVNAVDPNLPIYFVNTLDEAIDQNNWFYGVFGTLFLAFGAAALFLASVGLYGVVAFSVSRRTRELGIRRALGAANGDILGMIMRQGLMQLLIGSAIGLVIAFFLSKGLALVLFQVNPADPIIFGSVVVLLGAVTLLASYIPARRASLVDPMEALRYE
ncbi:MAG: ABC transporter permease [Gemmatimonadota bacterium]